MRIKKKSNIAVSRSDFDSRCKPGASSSWTELDFCFAIEHSWSFKTVICSTNSANHCLSRDAEHIRLTAFHWRCDKVEMRETCLEARSEVGYHKRCTLNTQLPSGTSENISSSSRNVRGRLIRSDLFWYWNNLKMKPTYRGKNFLDQFFGGFRSTLKLKYGQFELFRSGFQRETETGLAPVTLNVKHLWRSKNVTIDLGHTLWFFLVFLAKQIWSHFGHILVTNVTNQKHVECYFSVYPLLGDLSDWVFHQLVNALVLLSRTGSWVLSG